MPPGKTRSTKKTSHNKKPACLSQLRPQAAKYLSESEGGLPGGSVVKNPPAYAGDTGSIPDLGRSHVPQTN